MVKDLICGMDVNPKTAVFKAEYDGKTYYFCNKSCKVTFEKNPKLYIEAQNKEDGGK
jgi:YHS domain-containing protein